VRERGLIDKGDHSSVVEQTIHSCPPLTRNLGALQVTLRCR
jgi:hypothetical protein